MARIRIVFHRPGIGTTEWTQDLVAETSDFILTSFRFETKRPLVVDGVLVVTSGYSGYLFEMIRENTEVVAVFDYRDRPTGYYVNLNSEPRRIDGGYEVTDWFLDVWVFPDLRYRVLDADEFDAAVASSVIDSTTAARAREVLHRVENALAARDFPPAPIREFFLGRTADGSTAPGEGLTKSR